MPTLLNLTREDRERIRLRFFREFRGLPEFSSVAVRQDADAETWFLSVGATGAIELPELFDDLQVRTYRVGQAVHAVASTAHLS